MSQFTLILVAGLSLLPSLAFAGAKPHHRIKITTPTRRVFIKPHVDGMSVGNFPLNPHLMDRMSTGTFPRHGKHKNYKVLIVPK
jgi:hypothetical protein